jgi:hypothetical protein
MKCRKKGIVKVDVFCRDLICICICQGEAPAFIPNDLLGDFDRDIDMKCKGCQTAVNVGNKTVGCWNAKI